MEQNRYAQNHALYIIGMMSLVACLALLGFALYLMPYLVFGWVYNVPEFILHWREDLLNSYPITSAASAWMIFFSFLVPGLIAGLIAYIASNQIDNSIYDLKTSDSSQRLRREARETASILSKIVMIVILIFAAVAFFEWILYVPPRG